MATTTYAEDRACRCVDTLQDWIGGECSGASDVPAHVIRDARYETPTSDLTNPELLAVIFAGSREQSCAAVQELRDRYLAANAKWVAQLANETDDRHDSACIQFDAKWQAHKDAVAAGEPA